MTNRSRSAVHRAHGMVHLRLVMSDRPAERVARRRPRTSDPYLCHGAARRGGGAMEQRRDSRESRTLRAMYPKSPQLGDDPDATRVLTQVSRPQPTDRLPAIALPETAAPERTLIVPAKQQQQRMLARIPAAPQIRRPPVSRSSRLITFLALLVALVF